jgi:hypothetical protein
MAKLAEYSLQFRHGLPLALRIPFFSNRHAFEEKRIDREEIW